MIVNADNNRDERETEDTVPVSTLRSQYLDYLSVKAAEIAEQRQARHYAHGDQWTAAEIAALKARKQPVVTYNRIGRKVDGIVGLVERLRQDPKAYPRTPKHEGGADLATAALKYILDAADWRSKSPEVARDGAIEGLGGVEILIEPGDNGDPELNLSVIDPDTFFYDPRSFREDFSDGRFMGVAKWVDLDLAKEMFPDRADELAGIMNDGPSYSAQEDRSKTWVNSNEKRLFLIDQWYIKGGEWRYCIYCGDIDLMSGPSYLADNKGKTICKYIMFSAAVDHDGDRYGFVRNMKSPQDEMNARRSMAWSISASRRIIMDQGAVDDVEVLRREAVRPDGVIVRNQGLSLEFDDSSRNQDMMAQLRFLEDAKTEIDNFGPNPQLMGDAGAASSGKAIALLQQAGIAELGPYIIAYRGWKIRVYRALFSAMQAHWQAERWVRVTDDDGLAQFIQLNGIEMDEYGRPTMVNALGSLDVDIVLDEGPDSVNQMASAYDALTALAGAGAQVPPGLLIELAPGLTSTVKKKYLDAIEQGQQPNPMAEQAAVLELDGKAADIENKRASTAKMLSEAENKSADTAQKTVQTVAGFMAPQPLPMSPVEQGFM
jgi:hypothetical protein